MGKFGANYNNADDTCRHPGCLFVLYLPERIARRSLNIYSPSVGLAYNGCCTMSAPMLELQRIEQPHITSLEESKVRRGLFTSYLNRSI